LGTAAERVVLSGVVVYRPDFARDDSAQLDESEQKGVRFLAMRKGTPTAAHIDRAEFAEALGLSAEEAKRLWQRFISLGFIEIYYPDRATIPAIRSINPRVHDIVRELDKPPDRVAELQTFVRSHRFAGPLLFVLVASAAAATFLNQLFEALKHLGLWSR
jgi:hypothetical protein